MAGPTSARVSPAARRPDAMEVQWAGYGRWNVADGGGAAGLVTGRGTMPSEPFRLCALETKHPALWQINTSLIIIRL